MGHLKASTVQTARRSEPFSSPPPVHQAVWRRHQDQAGRVPAAKRRALQRPELRDPRQAAGPRAVQHPAVPLEPPLERGPLELGTLVTDSLSCLSETASFFPTRALFFESLRVTAVLVHRRRGATPPSPPFLSASSKFLVQSGGGDALAFNTPKKVQYHKILQ